MQVEEKELVDPAHLLLALEKKHGREFITLTDYQVSRATANILGITSVILRAKIFAKTKDGEIISDSLVIKRLPLCKSQLNLVNVCHSFEREIEYLTEFVPILERAVKSKLTLVECYFGRDRVLVMEDLCAGGFNTLVNTIGDLKHDLITLKHAEAVYKALAKIHVASLDFDWIGNFPTFLTDDPFFDNEGGDIFKTQLSSAIDGFLFLLEEGVKIEFNDVVGWLKSGVIYEILKKYVKSGEFSVLNQGDPWANNILFRSNTDKELELKFVDFQLGRFAPCTCDLFYFLFTSTNKMFRSKHEQLLKKHYVEEFNKAAEKRNVSFRLIYDEFEKHYNKSKLYGLMFAILCRPMLYMHKTTPSNEMSDEKFNEFIVRDYSAAAIDVNLRQEVKELFEEIVKFYHLEIC